MKQRIIDRPKPQNPKRAPRPENYSTDPEANLELIAEIVMDYGFTFSQSTRRSSGLFTAEFERDGKVFKGEGKTQLMANCIAALRVADYLDWLEQFS